MELGCKWLSPAMFKERSELMVLYQGEQKFLVYGV